MVISQHPYGNLMLSNFCTIINLVRFPACSPCKQAFRCKKNQYHCWPLHVELFPSSLLIEYKLHYVLPCLGSNHWARNWSRLDLQSHRQQKRVRTYAYDFALFLTCNVNFLIMLTSLCLWFPSYKIEPHLTSYSLVSGTNATNIGFPHNKFSHSLYMCPE